MKKTLTPRLRLILAGLLVLAGLHAAASIAAAAGTPNLTGRWTKLEPRCESTSDGVQCYLVGRFEVRNDGTAAADARTRTLFYLSDTPTIPAGLGPFVKRDIQPREPGASQVGSFTRGLPLGVDVIGKYVVSVIDALAAVDESDEVDNVQAVLVSALGPVPVESLRCLPAVWGNHEWVEKAIWSDRGSDAYRDVSFWRPLPLAGEVFLGDHASAGYERPIGPGCVFADDPALFAPATDFTLIWRDKDTGVSANVALFQPVCPAGFAALGHVAHHSWAKPDPSLLPFRCVRADLVTQAFDDRDVWNDRNSGAAGEVTVLGHDPYAFYDGTRGSTHVYFRAVEGYDPSVAEPPLQLVGPVRPTRDDDLHYVEGRLFARRSTVPIETRRELVARNLPVWLLAPGEPYAPKAFQAYKRYDVRDLSPNDDGSTNLTNWDDREHHEPGGEHNYMEPHLNRLGVFQLDTRDGAYHPTAIDPEAAPTYAFYVEKPDGEVWIYYFLFFGYNDAELLDGDLLTSLVGGTLAQSLIGALAGFGQDLLVDEYDHFADWIHVTVKLRPCTGGAPGLACPNGEPVGTHVPTGYYYSAHSGGEKVDALDSRIGFYLPTPDGLEEVGWNDAVAANRFHPGVFLAWGNHEAYVDRGIKSATDFAWYGGWALVPFATGEYAAQGVGLPVLETTPSNSHYDYAPVYAWDMSDPQESCETALRRAGLLDETLLAPVATPYRHAHTVYTGRSLFEPRPSTTVWRRDETRYMTPTGAEPDQDFCRMWLARRPDFPLGASSTDRTWRPIGKSGKYDAFFDGGDSATVPPAKILQWRGDFDK